MSKQNNLTVHQYQAIKKEVLDQIRESIDTSDNQLDEVSSYGSYSHSDHQFNNTQPNISPTKLDISPSDKPYQFNQVNIQQNLTKQNKHNFSKNDIGNEAKDLNLRKYSSIIINYDSLVGPYNQMLYLESLLQKQKHTIDKIDTIQNDFIKKVNSFQHQKMIDARKRQYQNQNKRLRSLSVSKPQQTDRLQEYKFGDLLKNRKQDDHIADDQTIQKATRPKFNLNLLSLYSKVLRPNDLNHKNYDPMLGNKYKEERERQMQIQIQNQVRDFERAPENHDWLKTPLYAQIFKSVSEVKSLYKSDFAKQILLKIQIKKFELNKRKQEQQYDQSNDHQPLSEEEESYLRLNDQKQMHTEILTIIKQVPCETQIRSWITQIRNLDHIHSNDLTFPQREEIWHRATLCLKVRMAQMGIEEVYRNIIGEYEQKKQDKFEHTLIKVLYRCSLAHRSADTIKKIFKMLIQTRQLKNQFMDRTKKLVIQKKQEGLENKKEREDILAKFCLLCSRLHTRISQFLEESGYFRGNKFILAGKNLQLNLEQQVKNLKKQYQYQFQNTIPYLNSDGRLIFN